MDLLETPLGIALVVLGLIVAVKAVKLAVKLLMVAVVVGGLYLAFTGG